MDVFTAAREMPFEARPRGRTLSKLRDQCELMIPGEILTLDGDITLNEGRPAITLPVSNTGDRPVQVGSHYHFFEVNPALQFDRARARGMRLDIPSGTAVRFEPGQRRDVRLIPYAGARRVVGFRCEVQGHLDTSAPRG